jgi:hypothetical protein
MTEPSLDGGSEMQFGRTYGIALMVLGILLCAFQFVHYMAPSKGEGTEQTQTRTGGQVNRVRSSLPGIVGAGSLVAGIALFITARRRDEPDPKYKVK